MNLKELIISEKATVIDVRTPSEFMGGSVPNSINVPLQELMDRLQEIRVLQTPLILCCASGGRSGMAEAMLQQQGIACMNAGSWLDVNYALSVNEN